MASGRMRHAGGHDIGGAVSMTVPKQYPAKDAGEPEGQGADDTDVLVAAPQ